MLTQEEVDQLPEGTRVSIIWSGGNGPHEYIIGKHYGLSYVRDHFTGGVRDRLWPVGSHPLTVVEEVSARLDENEYTVQPSRDRGPLVAHRGTRPVGCAETKEDRHMTFEQAVDEQLARMRDIMLDRHRKYGPNNITAGGIHGLITRIRDKLARIEQDHKNCPFMGECQTHDLPDEARDDAWLDLANYSGPIALMVLAGIWASPMEVAPVRMEHLPHNPPRHWRKVGRRWHNMSCDQPCDCRGLESVSDYPRHVEFSN